MSVRVLVSFFFASLQAFGQTPPAGRTYQFSRVTGAHDFQEVAIAIRMVADLRDVRADPATNTLTLRGTPQQIAIADWLVQELDQPPRDNPRSAEFRFDAADGVPAGVVRVQYFPPALSVPEFQEIATNFRTVGQVRFVFTRNAARAIVLRGTAEEMKLAAWLSEKMTLPVEQGQKERLAYEAGGRDGGVRLFYLKNAANVADLQEIAQALREMAFLRYVFTQNGPRILSIRGREDQTALSEWLMARLDPTASAGDHFIGRTRDMRLADEWARVHVLPASVTPAELRQLVESIRTEVRPHVVAGVGSRSAIVLRGRMEELAQASERIRQRAGQSGSGSR